MMKMMRIILLMTMMISTVQPISAKMKAVLLHSPGGPEQMYIADIPKPSATQNHVIIKIHATAINRADTLQRQGKYPVPAGESDIIGLEAAGTVEEVGPEVTRWKVGDKVMALLGGGGYAEYVSVSEGQVMSIPSGLSYVEAAAIPEAWLTAYQLLHFVGHVKKGESVLIHAAGSGVGTSAVQLAHDFGLTVYVTAGSQDKIDVALKLGAAGGCNYKQENFVDCIKQLTKGRGVDVVLDCVGGSYWEQNSEVLATDGRWVLYGTLGGVNVNGSLFAKLMQKRLSITASTLRSRSLEYKAELVKAFSDYSLSKFSDKQFAPVISEVLPFSEVTRAHQIMESNTNTGKIVLEVIPESKKSEL